MSKPKVSVVMGVYNGQEYLNTAIDSILLQTYKNIELIIIDDGSTDNSKSIIMNYNDKRIRYIHQVNQGLASALNRGIKEASGLYIARMDCDDISYPTRIGDQVAFLEKRKSIGLVGTSFDLIDQHGRIIDRSFHLDRPQDLNLEFLVRSPFGHGSVMIRKQVLDKVGQYDRKQPIEDYELWWRISQSYPMGNIPKQLYGWRVNPESMSHSGHAKRQAQIAALMEHIWKNAPPVKISRADIKQGVDHYSKLGPKYKEQYLYFLAALSLGLGGRKRRAESLFLKGALLSLPNGLKVLKDMKKNPRSHNYNLSNIRIR